MSRNLSSEILELKTRKEFESFGYTLNKLARLRKITSELTATEKSINQELYNYLPVAYVSTMESFFRSTIKKLIDSDELYFDRYKIANEKASLKFDFEILHNVNRKKITFW